MKYAEFNIDSNKIEFLNSIAGIETVLINGNRVSNKFSFLGTEHHFKINTKDFVLQSDYKLFDLHEIKLNFKEDNKLIESKSIKLDKKQRLFWTTCSIIIGIVAYKFLNSLF